MLSKKCPQCDIKFNKPDTCGLPEWNNRRKFCSRGCVNNFQKGKQLKNINYKTRVPWNKGKKCPAIMGKENTNWKGDDVGYVSLHEWIYRHKGRPQECEHCGTTEKRMYHWANKSRKYKRDLDDWIRLCVPCHSKNDNVYV